MKPRDLWIWFLCGLSLLFALHVWLSAPDYRGRLGALQTQLKAIENLGRVPPALRELQRRLATRNAAPEEPLRAWLAARTDADAVTIRSESETPLTGGWVRREAILVAEDADYAALERLLMGLSAREPRWVLESGEWTPSDTPGRGRVLLALATLVPPPLPPPAANGND